MEDFKVDQNFWEREGVTFDEKGHPIYFAEPLQVKFLETNAEDPRWLGGIAYKDQIICGCCGGAIPIEDFWDDVEEGWHSDPSGVNVTDEDAFIMYSNWVDINDAIMGD